MEQRIIFSQCTPQLWCFHFQNALKGWNVNCEWFKRTWGKSESLKRRIKERNSLKRVFYWIIMNFSKGKFILPLPGIARWKLELFVWIHSLYFYYFSLNFHNLKKIYSYNFHFFRLQYVVSYACVSLTEYVVQIQTTFIKWMRLKKWEKQKKVSYFNS